jgi:hypothetical protein
MSPREIICSRSWKLYGAGRSLYRRWRPAPTGRRGSKSRPRGTLS